MMGGKGIEGGHRIPLTVPCANKDLSSFGSLSPLPRVSVSGNLCGNAIAFERVRGEGAITGAGLDILLWKGFCLLSFHNDKIMQPTYSLVETISTDTRVQQAIDHNWFRVV